MSTSSQKNLYSKWCKKFDLVVYNLLAIERHEGTQEMERMGIVIDSKISLGVYLDFCEKKPRIPVKHRLIDGRIEAYETPVEPHSLVQGKLIGIMDNWNDQLRVMGETDITVGPRSLYRCDVCVRPMNIPQPQAALANRGGRAYPNLVV